MKKFSILILVFILLCFGSTTVYAENKDGPGSLTPPITESS